MKKLAVITLLSAMAGLGALIVVAQFAHAVIREMKQLQIDFTDASDAKSRATWSEPDRLTLSKEGLGWDGEAASSRDGWFHTKPLALGQSWRPPYGAGSASHVDRPGRPVAKGCGIGIGRELYWHQAGQEL